MAACADAGAVAFLERFGWVDAGGVPRGCAAEEDTGKRGGQQGEEQDRKVEVEIGLIRQRKIQHVVTVSRRDLSALHPGAWKSVTKSGRVDGKVSRITKGTTFTVSR